MREEREIYLENHPTKANGYYTRDLLTLVGPVEDLKVPRVREGDFHPQILPYRKQASLELSEVFGSLRRRCRGYTVPSTRPRVSPVWSRLPKSK